MIAQKSRFPEQDWIVLCMVALIRIMNTVAYYVMMVHAV